MTHFPRTTLTRRALRRKDAFRGHVQIQKHMGEEAAQTGWCLYQQAEPLKPQADHLNV